MSFGRVVWVMCCVVCCATQYVKGVGGGMVWSSEVDTVCCGLPLVGWFGFPAADPGAAADRCGSAAVCSRDRFFPFGL